GERIYSECGGPGRADIVNVGSGEGERIYSECGSGRPDIVKCRVRETRYSECGVRGDQI
ncbi:unnamed protein product, partial [Staurois parvus]